jgi:hypothetical protein
VTWTNLLANKEAQKHKTSKKELDNMRALIARDLADAIILLAFQQIGDSPLRTTRRPGGEYGHSLCGVSDREQSRTPPGVLGKYELVLGKAAHKYADYFEACRRKRNTLDYTFPMLRRTRKQKRSSCKQDSFMLKSKTGLRKTTPR